MHKRVRGYIFVAIGCLACLGLLAGITGVKAAEDSGEFHLQVSPSPLVTTLKPGQTATLELKVRNNGPKTEDLTIAPRRFTFDSKTQKLRLDDTKPPEVAGWVSFGAANFTIPSGQTYTQKVTIAVPKEAGFSYSFIVLIKRKNAPDPTATQVLKGSVAIFTLLNIDRPGAKRKIEIESLKTQQFYEYLPASFEIALKNTGNVFAQPAGNVFVQRGSNDSQPISALDLNPAGGYILPGTTRQINVAWEDGFPVDRTIVGTDGKTKKELEWNWSNLSHVRIGRYTAKVLAVYNDGQRDIPVEAEVSFWVVPWKILLGVLAVFLLIGAGVWSIVRKTIGLGKRVRRRRYI